MFLDLRTESGNQQDASWEIGIPLLGEHLMPNIGESPKEEEESTLSQILEDNVPQKYYLSERACQGVLQRAERRGKILPKILEKALKQQIERWRKYGSPLPVFEGEGIIAECYDARGNGDGKVVPTITGDHNGHMSDYTALLVENKAFSIDSLSSNSMKSNNPHSGFHETSIAKCLDTSDGSPNKNQGGTMIVHCNSFNGCYSVNGYDDKQKFPTICAGYSHYFSNNIGCIVNSTIEDTVCYSQDAYDKYEKNDRGSTLRASGGVYGGGSENLVCELVYCLQGNGIDRADTAGCNGCGWREDKSYTLNTIDRPAVVYSDDNVQYSVRRITPLECCRLQGFPDWWVKDVPRSDSQEYKMWGNGMALPNALYVMQGIVGE